MNNKLKAYILFIVASIAVTAGILVGGINSSQAGMAQQPAAQPAPSIQITQPLDGSRARGDSVQVVVAVSGLTLNGDAINRGNKDGIGNWELFVDGQYAGLGVSDIASIPNDALPHIAAGEHKIAVELHNDDHSVLAGAARSEITVNFANDMHYAAGTGPTGIHFVGLTDGAGIYPNPRLYVQVKVDTFKLDGTSIGTDNQTGIGHWHLYVDGQYAGLSDTSVFSVPNDVYPALSAGPHKLRVELHNNKHSFYQASISDTLGIYLLAATSLTSTTSAPSISLVSPTDGSTVGGGLVPVRVAVSGVRLDGDSINRPNRDRYGHWQMFVDDQYAGLGVSDVAALPNQAFPRITAGKHKISVELHNDDRSVMTGTTRIDATVNFANEMNYDLGAGPAGISIVQPTDGATASLDSRINVQVKVDSYTLDGTTVNTDNRDGIGHWHLYVDGQYAGLSVSDLFSVPNDVFPVLLPGQHQIRAELRANKHGPVAGTISQTVTVNLIAAPAPGAQPGAPPPASALPTSTPVIPVSTSPAAATIAAPTPTEIPMDMGGTQASGGSATGTGGNTGTSGGGAGPAGMPRTGYGAQGPDAGAAAAAGGNGVALLVALLACTALAAGILLRGRQGTRPK
jgi:hypothetical protein